MAVSHSTHPATLASVDSSFAQVLHADGPNPARATELALYAWIVGRWDIDVTTILGDGTTHRGDGEIHAGWVLQGLAIQDVWMIPRLPDRRPGIEPLAGAGNWYGTTLRIYDPELDAWRILWSDPATNFFTQQIARQQGRTSSRPARTRGAGRCDGSSVKSNRTRFAGWPNALWTTATGGAKSTSALVAHAAEPSRRPDRRRDATSRR